MFKSLNSTPNPTLSVDKVQHNPSSGTLKLWAGIILGALLWCLYSPELSIVLQVSTLSWTLLMHVCLQHMKSWREGVPIHECLECTDILSNGQTDRDNTIFQNTSYITRAAGQSCEIRDSWHISAGSCIITLFLQILAIVLFFYQVAVGVNSYSTQKFQPPPPPSLIICLI